jgi:hypothetical protein
LNVKWRNAAVTAAVAITIAATVKNASQNVESVNALIAGPDENRGRNCDPSFRGAQLTQPASPAVALQ